MTSANTAMGQVSATMNMCKEPAMDVAGKGTVRPYETYYPLYVEAVEEFAEFARQSGGFEIY